MRLQSVEASPSVELFDLRDLAQESPSSSQAPEPNLEESAIESVGNVCELPLAPARLQIVDHEKEAGFAIAGRTLGNASGLQPQSLNGRHCGVPLAIVKFGEFAPTCIVDNEETVSGLIGLEEI